jgi:hypothetical protein
MRAGAKLRRLRPVKPLRCHLLLQYRNTRWYDRQVTRVIRTILSWGAGARRTAPWLLYSYPLSSSWHSHSTKREKQRGAKRGGPEGHVVERAETMNLGAAL